MIHSKKQTRYQILINVIMIIVTLIIVLPFVLVLTSSLTDENVLIRNGYSFFPEEFSVYAYQYIIRQGEKILRAYLITIIVTVIGTVANIAMSALLAYPLSVKTLPHRNVITFFVFFTMLFNGGLVPTYLMYVNFFHIKNTIWALIIPNLLLSANTVLMIRSYFMTSIPDALFEAAKIDGAIQNLLNQMITDIQYLASGKITGNIGAEVAKLPTTSIRMAIAFIAMLPLFIIYPFLQKYFSEGITLGAVKG